MKDDIPDIAKVERALKDADLVLARMLDYSYERIESFSLGDAEKARHQITEALMILSQYKDILDVFRKESK